MALRQPVSDEELLRRHFEAFETSAYVLGQVRTIIADHLEYPAEKLLPDDDLSHWSELDMSHMIAELEHEFAIKFTDAELADTKFTIRAVTTLVTRKRRLSKDIPFDNATG